MREYHQKPFYPLFLVREDPEAQRDPLGLPLVSLPVACDSAEAGDIIHAKWDEEPNIFMYLLANGKKAVPLWDHRQEWQSYRIQEAKQNDD